MTIGAFCLGLVVTTQALHSRLMDLSVLLSGSMTDIAVQQSREYASGGERDAHKC